MRFGGKAGVRTVSEHPPDTPENRQTSRSAEAKRSRVPLRAS